VPPRTASGSGFWAACGCSTITFTATDTDQGAASYTAIFTVTPINDLPIGETDQYYVNSLMREDQINKYTLIVAAPGLLNNDHDIDGDTLTATLKPGQSLKGEVQLNSNGSFSYTYTDSTPGNDSDSFVYILSDGHGGSAEVNVILIIDLVPPPVTLTWLEPVAQPEVTFTTDEMQLLLKVHLSATTDVVNVEFRWWNTAINPVNWGGIYTQPSASGQLAYSHTLNMVLLPYLPDIQTFAYIYDQAGNRQRIRFFIDHQIPENAIFLPLIMR